MTLGGSGESIEELSVRLVADNSEFLEDVNTSIDESISKVEELGSAWDKFTAEQKKVAQEVAQAMNLAEIREDATELEETLQSLSEELGVSREELLAYANVWQSQVSGVIEDQKRQFAELVNQFEGRKVIPEDYVASVMEAIDSNRLLAGSEEELERVTASFGDQLQAAQGYLEELPDVISPAEAAFNQITDAFGGFLAQLTIGALVLKGIQALFQFLQGGVQMAIQGEKVFRQFEIQIRRFQRTSGEAAGTISEWNEFTEELTEKYGGDFDANLQQVGQTVGRLSNEMSFNKDQMMELVEAGTILARVNGDLGNSYPQLLNAIQTGTPEAFRTLGLTYNEALFAQKALEMGITEATDEMSEQEKQLIRLNLILDQTSELAEDAAATMDTMAGRMEAANQQIQDAQAFFGNVFAPQVVALKELWAQAIEGMASLWGVFVLTIGHGIAILVAEFVRLINIIGLTVEAIEEGTYDMERIQEEAAEAAQRAYEDIFVNGVKKLTSGFEELGDTAQTEFPKVADGAEEMSSKVQQAFDKASVAIEDATRRWEEGVAKAAQTLADRVDDILRDAARRRQDLATDLSRDLTDMQNKAAVQRQDAIRKANQNELEERERFQQDMRDLENKFLFQLEDALRDRDARRVIDILRRMKEEKRKRTQEFKQRQKEIKRNLKWELESINRNLAQQRKARIEAYKRELQDLNLQTQRKLADARLRYERELRDLQISIMNRLNMVAQGIAQELQLNAQGLEALYNMFNQAYGAGGWMEAFYLRYAQMLAAMGGSGTIPSYAQPPSTYVPPGGGGGGGTRPARAFARGALNMVATSPTPIIVGERPELVNVSPLNAGTGMPNAGFGGGNGQGKMVLSVKMGDGLVAEIVDSSMAGMAELLVDIENNG